MRPPNGLHRGGHGKRTQRTGDRPARDPRGGSLVERYRLRSGIGVNGLRSTPRFMVEHEVDRRHPEL